jgi:hypothetical protein
VRWPEEAARYCGKYFLKDEAVDVVFSQRFGQPIPSVLL